MRYKRIVILFILLMIIFNFFNKIAKTADISVFSESSNITEDFLLPGKEDDFYGKIHELLTLKYPSKVVYALENESAKEYTFNDTYLFIKYTGSEYLKESSREYTLKVDFHEIKDYLKVPVSLSEEYTNESGFLYDKDKVSIIFSFDDSPNGDKTQKLINALEDYKMSATFYMVGNKLNRYKDAVQKVALSHSEIGYHSYEHKSFKTQTKYEIMEEYNSSLDILKVLTSKSFSSVRPPYGLYDEEILKMIDKPFISWDIDTLDWKYRDSKYVYNKVINEAKDGDIILFHDSYNTTIDASLKLLEYFYLNDVQVLSVSDFCNLRGIKLNNHQMYHSFK